MKQEKSNRGRKGYPLDFKWRVIDDLLATGESIATTSKRYDITYISCQPSQTKRIGAKVILIGGGKDETAANQPALAKRMRANGMQTALYWDAADTHYTLLHNRKAIIAFLNKEIELS